MLEAPTKQCVNKRNMRIDQFLSDEILDASQKMKIAHKEMMIFINMLKPIVVFCIIDGGELLKCKKKNSATG